MDIPYIVFYSILLVLAFMYKKKSNKNIAICSFVLTFFFFAFRAPVVGADTWDYIRYLTGERNFYNYDTRELETGFVIYRSLISSITSSRFIVMIINSILILFPFFGVLKYSSNIPFSLFVFFNLNGMSIYFCALRQLLAFSCFLVAVLYYMNNDSNKIKKYIVLFIAGLIGQFLHTSSIIYVVLFFLVTLIGNVNKKIYLFLIIGSALVGIVLESFDSLSFLKKLSLWFSLSPVERLSGYLSSDELFDDRSLTLLLRPSFLFLIAVYFLSSEDLSHPFCKFSLFGVVLFNLFGYIPIVYRLCVPFFVFLTIVFAWIFDKKYTSITKYRVRSIIVILVSLYFVRSVIIDCTEYDINTATKMHPYQFIFQEYHDRIIR